MGACAGTAGAMGTQVSPNERGHEAGDPLVPLPATPSMEWDPCTPGKGPSPSQHGLTNLPPWKEKHHFSLGPSIHGAERGEPGAGIPPGKQQGARAPAPRPRGVGGRPGCSPAFLGCPEGAGGGWDGLGGRSSLVT